MFITISLSTILIIILVIMINGRASIEDKFGILGVIVAIIFGWIAVAYILIRYNRYIFGWNGRNGSSK